MLTVNRTTDLFNGAFSEVVMQNLDFHTKKWKAIKGGLKNLVNNAVALIETKPQTKKRVTAIALDEKSPDGPRPMKVQVAGETSPRTYDAVMTTTILGCLHHMDLDDAEVDWSKRTAIQALQGAPAQECDQVQEGVVDHRLQDHQGGRRQDRRSHPVVCLSLVQH